MINLNEITFQNNTCDENDSKVIFTLSEDLIDKYEDLEKINYSKVINWVKENIQANIKNYVKIIYMDKTIGYYKISFVENKYELDDFYIIEKYRNMGIGSFALKNIFKNTDKPIFLYVFTKNIGAINLYKKFGFEITEKVCETRIIMTKTI